MANSWFFFLIEFKGCFCIILKYRYRYLINIGWIRIRMDPELWKFKAGSGSGINHSGSTTLRLTIRLLLVRYASFQSSSPYLTPRSSLWCPGSRRHTWGWPCSGPPAASWHSPPSSTSAAHSAWASGRPFRVETMLIKYDQVEASTKQQYMAYLHIFQGVQESIFFGLSRNRKLKLVIFTDLVKSSKKVAERIFRILWFCEHTSIDR